jgi:hypothetical protein
MLTKADEEGRGDSGAVGTICVELDGNRFDAFPK